MASLILKRGDTVLSTTPSNTPLTHHEQDFDVEWQAGGRLVVRNRGNTPFLVADPVTRTYTLDVLNVPHVDVGRRKAELEAAKQKAAAAKKE